MARAELPVAAPSAAAAPVEIPVAELRARYDTLWAISDVHGHRDELERLLVASRLAVRTGPGLSWNPASRRQLLVVAGDLIDGGDDSVGVTLLLERLQREAAESGSAIVVLLGNHEAAFLADPRTADRKLLDSAAAHAGELGLRRRVTPERLDASPFGEFLRRLPVAAVVGTWLFAHAGCIQAEEAAGGLRPYLDHLRDAAARGDRSAYAALLDRDSLVACHGWSRAERPRAKMRRRLDALGLSGLVIGHDPEALGIVGTMAVHRDGWLLKLDAGLKLGRSAGMLLRCAVPDIAGGRELAMMRGASPTCRTEAVTGSAPLPVVR